MNCEVAVFDAGPLIIVQQAGHLELLHGLFARAVVPPAVAREVAPSLGTLPGWFEVQRVLAFPTFSRMPGIGERSAIAFAMQWSADFIVLDDLRARTVATEHGLPVIGSLGQLVRAKRRGRMREVQPTLDEMISAGLYAS